MTARDRDRLTGVHPYLAKAIERIIDAMLVLGYPMFVVEGTRDTARQQLLYAQGRSLPGPIVSNADGIVKKSMHQIQATGYGHAVDCAFVDDPHTTLVETWSERQPWEVYAAMLEAFGLTSGRHWTFKDSPHGELSLSSPHV